MNQWKKIYLQYYVKYKSITVGLKECRLYIRKKVHIFKVDHQDVEKVVIGVRNGIGITEGRK